MTTTIEINRLRLYAFHGVLPREREVGNEFEVTLHLECDMTEAMTCDRLDGTVSYADVIELVKAEMAVPSQLLEHVAWRIKSAVVRDFPKVTGGYIKVAKLRPPVTAQLESAAVMLKWNNNG